MLHYFNMLYFATIHVLTHNPNRITVIFHDNPTILISKNVSQFILFHGILLPRDLVLKKTTIQIEVIIALFTPY